MRRTVFELGHSPCFEEEKELGCIGTVEPNPAGHAPVNHNARYLLVLRHVHRSAAYRAQGVDLASGPTSRKPGHKSLDFAREILGRDFPGQAFELIAVKPKPAAGIAQIQLQRAQADDFGGATAIGTIQWLGFVPSTELHNSSIAVNTSSGSHGGWFAAEWALSR